MQPAQPGAAPPSSEQKPPAAAAAVPTVPAPRPAAPAPDVSRVKALAERFTAKFPTVKVDYVKERRLKVTVTPSEIKAAAAFVRDGLGFDHLEVVGGTDYLQQGEFEVVYFVGSVSTPGQEDLVIQLAERVKRESASVPSLTEVWGGAEFHERETFEMLGVVFEGHPDLRRLLLPEDWNDLPPLRKDYTSPGR